MKRFFKYLACVLLLGAVATACNDDNGTIVIYYSYGHIDFADESKQSATLINDSGEVLFITRTGMSLSRLEDGERVIYSYQLDGGAVAEADYNVTVYEIYSVLTKSPVYQVEEESAEDDEFTDEELGPDLIEVRRAWFGDKYLNITFSFANNPSLMGTQKHFINLVVGEDPGPDGEVVLTLRHNGYNDSPIKNPGYVFDWAYGRVSFDLTSLVPDGEDEVDIILQWTDYGNTWTSAGVPKEDSGTFKLTDNNETIMGTESDVMSSTDSGYTE